jgi:hypothetical protein
MSCERAGTLAIPAQAQRLSRGRAGDAQTRGGTRPTIVFTTGISGKVDYGACIHDRCWANTRMLSVASVSSIVHA